MLRLPVLTVLAAAFTCLGSAALGQNRDAGFETPLEWVTLGTNGGPRADANRSEPANLLLVDGTPILVDCGDGAVEKLAQAGFQATDVATVFLSHLHLDHIGGLQGFIGLRWMNGAQDRLTIYGPPGTDTLVAQILRSLEPSLRIAQAEPMRGLVPTEMVRVVILTDGAITHIGALTVCSVRNSHFDDSSGRPIDNGSQSLSMRFDHSARSITYTGDTGPTLTISRLARGSDILVSEVIDCEALDALVARTTSAARSAALAGHFKLHHLSAEEAGAIATAAGVHKLIFTHLGVVGRTDDVRGKLVEQSHRTFGGETIVARDLDRFLTVAKAANP